MQVVIGGLSAMAPSGRLSARRGGIRQYAAILCNPWRSFVVSYAGNAMRSLLKSGLLINLEQNKAGLIADLAILLLFLVLLAAR